MACKCHHFQIPSEVIDYRGHYNEYAVLVRKSKTIDKARTPIILTHHSGTASAVDVLPASHYSTLMCEHTSQHTTTCWELYLEPEGLMVCRSDVLHQLKPWRLPVTLAAQFIQHRHWVLTCTHEHAVSPAILQVKLSY